MQRLGDFVDYLFSRQRWVIHLFYWLFVLSFYVIFFGRKNSNYTQTFFFVGLLMPVTIGATYFLNYFLVPRFLLKERYFFFLLYFIYTLVGAIFLEMIIALLTFIVIAELQNKKMSPVSMDIVFLMTSLLMVVFLGVAIKLLAHWRKSKEDNERLLRDKVEAELRFLKVQLNPHFLFNTLNNLYYLATEKSERAPQAILELSEMLEYVLHQGKHLFVPLEKELRQVENYIALELLRYEDRVKIDKEIVGEVGSQMIGPMMLVTLIENAFKHGVMNSVGKAWIKMKVDSNEERIDIVISNSCKGKELSGGIGINNLRGQLNHLYPGRSSLEIDATLSDHFSVRLILKSSL